MKKFLKILAFIIVAFIIVGIGVPMFYAKVINREVGAIATIESYAVTLNMYSGIKTDTRNADVYDYIACLNFEKFKTKYASQKIDLKLSTIEQEMRMWKSSDKKRYNQAKQRRDGYLWLKEKQGKYIDSLKNEIKLLREKPFDHLYIDHSFSWRHPISGGIDYGNVIGIYSRSEKEIVCGIFIDNLVDKKWYEEFVFLLQD